MADQLTFDFLFERPERKEKPYFNTLGLVLPWEFDLLTKEQQEEQKKRERELPKFSQKNAGKIKENF